MTALPEVWLVFCALLACAALLVAPLEAADPWQTDLFVGGHDVWHARVALDLTNTSAGTLAGFPVEVRVGVVEGEVALVGAAARSVRVCDAAGTEMLLDLRGPEGQRLGDGPIPEGCGLIVPATVPPQGVQRLYVYFDNPEAYLLPEYLNARAKAENGGFETGTGDLPQGWQLASGDERHRAHWVDEQPHGGLRCVRVDVDAGAEARWVTVHQTEVPVVPGRRYRVTGQVRGEGVTGQAGWYVHVATADDPQAVNRVEKGGDGTFGWRLVTIEFTAPEAATALSFGTILHGTGTAWFDDASVECLDGEMPGVEVKVGAVERLAPQRVGPGPWSATTGDRECRLRAPLYVTNVSDAPARLLVSCPSSPLVRRLIRGLPSPRPVHITDPAGGESLPYTLVGDGLLFRGGVPARCTKVFSAYLGPGAGAEADGSAGYGDLVASSANLAQNPSFESDGLGWESMVEGQDQVTAEMGLARGGRLGERCGRLAVGPGAGGHWTGWQQDVTVEPNADYIFTAWVRTEDVANGRVRIHAHLFTPDGTRLSMWSGGPDLVGTTDWTLLGGTLRTTPETGRVRLFLTMNAEGTAYHDAVLFARTMPATVGDLERRAAPDEPPLHVWTENPLVKVFRDTPPGPRPGRIELLANRGEEESLQLCLQAREDSSVRVTVDALRGGGIRLPPPRIDRVGFVPCLVPSSFDRTEAPAWERRKPNAPDRTDGWQGWWPDYLVPVTGAVELQAGRTQPVLLTFTVPRDAPPGTYRGTVEIAAGTDRVSVPITLQVGHLQLPERPTLQALFDVRDGPGWSQYDTPEKVERWWRFMADHRICPDHVRPEPTFALVDGQVTMDATEFDRAAELLFDRLHMAAAYFPQVFYSFGWGHTPRPFLGLEYPTPEYQAAYKAGVKLFWEHVKAKGWADRFSLYVSDEPHYQRPEVVTDLANVIRLTREVDPSIPVYSSTWGHEPAWDGVLNHWGIGQYGIFPLDALRQRQAAGDEIWFTVDGQLELQTPYNAYERMLPYYCLAYDVSGYEFWALAWYTYDPVRFGWYSFLYHSFSADEHSYDRYPNGSGHLAYPGELLGLEGPLSSIRLEQVREGLEDYETLIALKRMAEARPEVRQRVEPLLSEVKALVPIPNAGGYRSREILPDPDALPRLRDRAFRLLEELTPP